MPISYDVDKSLNVTKVVITLSVPGVKPKPEEVLKQLRIALKEHGINVFWSHLEEIIKGDLLPSNILNHVFDHACKVAGI